jgi:hypothetical protein
MTKGFATEKDIIKLVAKEHDICLKTAEYAYKFFIKLIGDLACQDGVLTVHLPYLGSMYKCNRKLHKYLRMSGEFDNPKTRNARASIERIKSFREIDPETGKVTARGLCHRKMPILSKRNFNKFAPSISKFEEHHNDIKNM